jgi:hypothetical protein
MLPGEKFARPKPRARNKPARHVKLSPEERAQYEALANQHGQTEKAYEIHVPVDRRKI